ncbi:FHA domain-containing protein [Planctomicrobium sp. SH664]|uniref:FHA domain-containing protein n=1 Tax=Planctomicrobium sp. SH664 TaxID=3448125 RepID=UPI003F5AF21E
MENQLLAMLQYAAAVQNPLRLLVRAVDGSETTHEINSAFAIVGRGDDCDVVIPDQTVSYRHLYLQAIGSQVACIDLFSTGGVRASGPKFHGWLTSQNTLQIGSARIQLLDEAWIADETLKAPLEFRPRDEQRPEYGLLPMVDLELLNTAQHGKKWPINRVITLVGRDERCRITVMDDRLSRVQCSLLLLPSGLWAIDMLGKGGIQINGQECRCALLAAGAELSFGPYRVRAHYPQIEARQLQGNMTAQTPEADFLTRSNRILKVEFYHDTVIILPTAESQNFLYQDLHIEASRITDIISQRGYRHVVVDFSQTAMAGHLLLEVLMSICRSTPGRTVLCGADENVFNALQMSPLNRRYQHYQNRHEALQAVYLPL